jgi:RNA polymerase sigma factor (sigma-70 family)
MKLLPLDQALVQRAKQGELVALDTLLVHIQPMVFNLAMRMLGQREDAQDAAQEILLRITTHLASFKGESKFETWVYRVATNHLLTARTRRGETPEISLDAMEEKLGAGMVYAESLGLQADAHSLLPEDQLAARRIALDCTQGMLMGLDRDHRVAYILDVVFALESADAAQVLQINPDAYRKRLSRAREKLQAFMTKTCSLVSPNALCRCAQQALVLQKLAPAPASSAARYAEDELMELKRLSDAAAVFRGHPQYKVPGVMIDTIRAVIMHHERRWQ